MDYEAKALHDERVYEVKGLSSHRYKDMSVEADYPKKIYPSKTNFLLRKALFSNKKIAVDKEYLKEVQAYFFPWQYLVGEHYVYINKDGFQRTFSIP